LIELLFIILVVGALMIWAGFVANYFWLVYKDRKRKQEGGETHAKNNTFVCGNTLAFNEHNSTAKKILR